MKIRISLSLVAMLGKNMMLQSILSAAAMWTVGTSKGLLPGMYPEVSRQLVRRLKLAATYRATV